MRYWVEVGKDGHYTTRVFKEKSFNSRQRAEEFAARNLKSGHAIDISEVEGGSQHSIIARGAKNGGAFWKPFGRFKYASASRIARSRRWGSA